MCVGYAGEDMRTTGIDHVNLGFPADRLDEVIDFYVDTLGFETGFEDPHAAVRDDPGLFAIELGEACQLYVRPTEEFSSDAQNFRHVALRISESPSELREFFESEGIDIDHTAERESEQFGPYTSYYVTDPFGYTVEFMAFGG